MRMTTGCWCWCLSVNYYCSHYSVVVDGLATTTTTTTTTTTLISPCYSHSLLPTHHYSFTRIYAKRRSYDNNNGDDDENDNDDDNNYRNRNNNNSKKKKYNRNNNNNNQRNNNRNRNYNDDDVDEVNDEHQEQEIYNGSTNIAVANADTVDSGRSNTLITTTTTTTTTDDVVVDENDDDEDDDETSSSVVKEILLKMKNVAAITVSANTNTFLDNKRQQQHSPQQDTVNTVSATAIEVPLSFTKQQIYDSINNAISILSNGLIERKEDSKLVVLAFLAKEHILLVRTVHTVNSHGHVMPSINPPTYPQAKQP